MITKIPRERLVHTTLQFRIVAVGDVPTCVPSALMFKLARVFIYLFIRVAHPFIVGAQVPRCFLGVWRQSTLPQNIAYDRTNGTPSGGFVQEHCIIDHLGTRLLRGTSHKMDGKHSHGGWCFHSGYLGFAPTHP